MECEFELDVRDYRKGEGPELTDLGLDLIEDTVAALKVGQSAQFICGSRPTARIYVRRTEQYTIVVRSGYHDEPSKFTNHRHAGRMAWRLAELKIECN